MDSTTRVRIKLTHRKDVPHFCLCLTLLPDAAAWARQVFSSHQAQTAAGGAVSQEEARRMDGALLAVGIMGDVLKQKVGTHLNHFELVLIVLIVRISLTMHLQQTERTCVGSRLNYFE